MINTDKIQPEVEISPEEEEYWENAYITSLIDEFYGEYGRLVADAITANEEHVRRKLINMLVKEAVKYTRKY